MSKEHHVIVVPGLGDENKYLAWEVDRWKKYGLSPQLHSAPWAGDEQFEPKLDRLTALIDLLTGRGNVSLVGISAGGSLALNAFAHRREVIHKVATVCAPLRRAEHTFFWRHIMGRYPAFVESLDLVEQNQLMLTPEDRIRILTTHALLDEQVPNSTTTLPGARNILIPIIGHQLALTLAMTVFKGQIINFLKED